ncbi:MULTISPECIES: hypothetical protein [Paraburkholderia]|jgi:hypothetical protein|uniref:Uncharacterized protein n=1 Tax=Paraburkholderia strydomiana TaxID=1245417 RepID=A0ABW9ESA5_9BURK|nr:hypothetical protein [Paraburkholderia gardini]CAG4890827.1 hypothetical protein R69919_01046 [Paraburkholderia gardini]
MVSQRTRLSLCQFLALQEPTVCTVLLGKAGIFSDLYPALLLRGLTDTLTRADQNAMMVVLDEIVRTQGNLRSAVSPRYRFDERWTDLVQCLVLDGYVVEDREIRASDPSIGDATPIDDDLLRELGSCGAPRASEIIRKINESTEMFRATPPNYNASLNDARIALETLAVDIAESMKAPKDHNYNASKWGTVISYLRTAGLITLEEEKGLAGVYGFVSPGSHRPVGVSEEQMARLGRSLALGMCWFLLKRKLGSGL